MNHHGATPTGISRNCVITIWCHFLKLSHLMLDGPDHNGFEEKC